MTRMTIACVSLGMLVGCLGDEAVDRSPTVTPSGSCTGITTSEGGCRCVDGTWWEADFDSDPTRLDVNGDGAGDWNVRDSNVGFSTSELVDGVWHTTLPIRLTTAPLESFKVPTSVHLRWRDTTLGGKGAVLWINPAVSSTQSAVLYVSTALDGAGGQTVTLFARDAAYEEVELARYPGLPTSMLDLWLLLEPSLDQVTVWLEGEQRGTYSYPLTGGASSMAAASLLGWGSEGEFDFVRIESCPDGVENPVFIPCLGVECSGHGTCVTKNAAPTCGCDVNYHADGLSCVADTCATGEVSCGGTCISPLTNEQHCGAQGDCSGTNAGQACATEEVCDNGACVTHTAPEVSIYVALSGTDSASCGGVSTPCRSVEYAAEQRAGPGQLIGIQPGTYDETGSIAIPKEVSLRGLGVDAAAVVLRPNYTMAKNDYFIHLASAEVSQDGKQSLSYLTLEGHTPDHLGEHAIVLRNRNNVRIHHCRITNWDRQHDPFWFSYAVSVETTFDFQNHPADPDAVLPADLGEPGDYSKWVDFPQDPVTNFEFDHNYVYRSGPALPYDPDTGKGSDRPGAAINVVNARDSQFHHNEIDNRGVYARGISGVTAYWNNVDVYKNVLRVSDAWAERWIPPTAPSHSTYVLEMWLHINGCEYYENISNDGLSIGMHKDSTVRHNVVLSHRNASVGLELGWMHHSQAHHNYILGGTGAGISAAHHRSNNRNDRIYENILVNVQHWGITVGHNKKWCLVDQSGANTAIYNNLIDTTRYGPIAITARCDSAQPPADIFIRNNILINAPSPWPGISFYVGPNYDAFNSVVENNVLYNNAGGDIRCSCRDESGATVTCIDGCDGRVGVASVNADPLFVGSDIVVVNDSDSSGVAKRGSWNATTSADLRRYEDDALVHTGGEGDYVEFRASELPRESPTLVALWWPRNLSASRSAQVPVSVYDGSNTTSVANYSVDQGSWDSGGWYYLGMHVFTSGTARLRVHSVTGAQVVADAALFSKLGAGYKLRSSSKAVDAGTSSVTAVVDTDFFGKPLPSTGVDVGIHER